MNKTDKLRLLFSTTLEGRFSSHWQITVYTSVYLPRSNAA